MKSKAAVLGAVIAVAVAGASASAATQETTSPPTGPATELHLLCAGEASFTRAHGGRAFGSRFTTYDESRIDDDVLVDITGDGGRIRIPRRMLPSMHSGDDEGWRPISPLSVGDREINGRFSMNFANKPSVSIDRATGRIEIAGHRDFGFRGDCRAYDPSAERKF